MDKGTPLLQLQGCRKAKKDTVSHQLKNWLFLAILIFGLSAFYTLSADAPAQQNKTIQELSLEELLKIKVNIASLLDADRLSAASSVERVTAQEWQNSGARSMLDALRYADSTFVLPSGAGVDVLSIRGYSRANSFLGVMTTWDGVPLDDLYRQSAQLNLPSINLGALNELQVVKGPGSAIHGGNAFHGLVALKGFESDENSTKLSGLFASNGYFDTSFKFSDQTTQSMRMNLAIAANGQSDQAQVAHYIDPNTLMDSSIERANEYDAITGSLKFVSELENDISWEGGIYIHSFDSSEFQGAGTTASGGRDLGSVNSDFYMGRLAIKKRWSEDQSLEINSYYWAIDNQNVIGLFDTASGQLVDRAAQSEQYRGGIQGIFRSSLPGLNSHYALALGREELAIPDARNRFEIAQDGSFLRLGSNPVDGASRSISSAILEVQTTWSDERWRLIYGGRSDHYSDVGSHFSPRLGIVYQMQPNSAFKFLYGNAFRPPTMVEVRGSPGFVQENQSLKPETIDSYELVYMQVKRNWETKFTLFKSEWKDGIRITSLPGPAPNLINLNWARNKANGASLSMHKKTDKWLFDWSGSYVDSKNVDSGNNYSLYPKYIFNFRLGYDIEQWDAQVFLNQRYFWKTYDVDSVELALEATELPTYARTDITFNKSFGSGLTLFGQIINMFDRDNLLPSSFGSVGGIPDEPFSVGLGLRYQF